MKKAGLTIIAILTFTIGFAQNTEKKPLKTGHSKPLKSSEGTTVSSSKNANTNSNGIYLKAGTKKKETKVVSKDIAYYDKTISDIEKKIALVKANTEENKRAEENGWYKRIYAMLANLKIERAKLISKK